MDYKGEDSDQVSLATSGMDSKENKTKSYKSSDQSRKSDQNKILFGKDLDRKNEHKDNSIENKHLEHQFEKTFIDISDFSDITSIESDGYKPKKEKKSTFIQNLHSTPSVFNKLTEEQRLQKLDQIINEINKGNKYYCINSCKDLSFSSHSKFECFFYTNTNRVKNSKEDYSIKYENILNYTCNFNCKYFDRELTELLLPIIHPDSHLFFENINYSTYKNINLLESLFSDYSIDLYAEIDKRKIIMLFPEGFTMTKDSCLINSDFLFKIIKVISNTFIKDSLFIIVSNSKMTDVDFVNLLQHKLCGIITIKNCIIKCTNKKINCKNL